MLELGDSRSPDIQVPQQRVVAHLCGHPSAFVPYAVAPDEVATALRVRGVSQS